MNAIPYRFAGFHSLPEPKPGTNVYVFVSPAPCVISVPFASGYMYIITSPNCDSPLLFARVCGRFAIVTVRCTVAKNSFAPESARSVVTVTSTLPPFCFTSIFAIDVGGICETRLLIAATPDAGLMLSVPPTRRYGIPLIP